MPLVPMNTRYLELQKKVDSGKTLTAAERKEFDKLKKEHEATLLKMGLNPKAKEGAGDKGLKVEKGKKEPKPETYSWSEVRRALKDTPQECKDAPNKSECVGFKAGQKLMQNREANPLPELRKEFEEAEEKCTDPKDPSSEPSDACIRDVLKMNAEKRAGHLNPSPPDAGVSVDFNAPPYSPTPRKLSPEVKAGFEEMQKTSEEYGVDLTLHSAYTGETQKADPKIGSGTPSKPTQNADGIEYQERLWLEKGAKVWGDPASSSKPKLEKYKDPMFGDHD